VSELKKLLKEGKDWLNAFDVCLNGEDAQMVKLVEEILTLRRKIDELEKKLAEAVEALRFYSIYSPRQFPEGYYEICIEEEVGGHNRFGTMASKTLKSLEEKEGER